MYSNPFQLVPIFTTDSCRFNEFIRKEFGNSAYDINELENLVCGDMWGINVGPSNKTNELDRNRIQRFRSGIVEKGVSQILMQDLYERGRVEAGGYAVCIH